MRIFNQKQFIKKLIACSPRQLEGEKRAARLILKTLTSRKIPFIREKFSIFIPRVIKASLIVDRKKIKCKACSFVGGKIDGKEKIISSMFHFDDLETEIPNINFNPYSKGISCVTHYFAPALAIAPKDIARLVSSKNASGEVKIKKILHVSENILVGNTTNPKCVFFNHYDSVNMGAYDNASGVSVTMDAIFTHPKILANNLFIFAGAEEISYDKPIYWAYGYRAFEKKHLSILKKAKKIIVVDCVGAGLSSLSNDSSFIYQAFPIKNVKKLGKKIFGLHSSFERLLPVYHSDLDDGAMLTEHFLKQASRIIIKEGL